MLFRSRVSPSCPPLPPPTARTRGSPDPDQAQWTHDRLLLDIVARGERHREGVRGHRLGRGREVLGEGRVVESASAVAERVG